MWILSQNASTYISSVSPGSTDPNVYHGLHIALPISTTPTAVGLFDTNDILFWRRFWQRSWKAWATSRKNISLGSPLESSQISAATLFIQTTLHPIRLLIIKMVLGWAFASAGQALGWVASKVAVNKMTEQNKKDGGSGNLYKESIKNDNVGVMLTWIENRPVIGDLLQKLGDNREKLYKILASSDGNVVSSKGLPQFHDFDGLIG